MSNCVRVVLTGRIPAVTRKQINQPHSGNQENRRARLNSMIKVIQPKCGPVSAVLVVFLGGGGAVFSNTVTLCPSVKVYCRLQLIFF
jgi:hypothetical protein